MKKSVWALVAMSLVSAAALADDGLTANLTLASKYKYRGQDQSNAGRGFVPAIQGGFDYTKGGWYLGNWNSSIDLAGAGGTETDVYGGFKGEAAGLGYDVGVLSYVYAGPKGHVDATTLEWADGSSKYNTTEIYGALSQGPLSLKYSHVVSGKYFGFDSGKNTGYIDLSGNFDLGNNLTLNTHVGYTNMASDAKTACVAAESYCASFVDYKLGVTKDIGNKRTISGAWVGATKDKKTEYGEGNKGRVIVSVTQNF